MGAETYIVKEVTVAATDIGGRLFRNNSGAFQDATGRWIRYGVASPGGSDLIGWMPVVVTQDMVGKKIAVFTAVEVKTATGKAKPEQLAFIESVCRAGGNAGIVRSVQDLIQLLNPPR